MPRECWPVAIYDKRKPVVSDGYHARENGWHAGVDICFRRLKTDPPFNPKAPGHDGTKLFYSPDDAGIVAATEGKIWSVKENPRGWSIVIDRGDIATYYQHLASDVRVTKGQIVTAGTRIGTMGYDPKQGPNAFRHCHFEIWKGGPADHVNPVPYLKEWPMVSL